MKSILVLALLSIVLVMGVSQAYAENITIQLNSDSHMTGEKIIVTGNTNAYLNNQ